MGRFRLSMARECLMITGVQKSAKRSGSPVASLPKTSEHGYSKAISGSGVLALSMNA